MGNEWMSFGIELQLCAKNENSTDEHDINEKVPNSLTPYHYAAFFFFRLLNRG